MTFVRFEQHLARLRVDDQVDVALAVAHLDVGQAVELLRQRVERLGEQDQLLHVHRDLAGLGAEHLAPRADEVAEVEQAQVRERLLAQRVLAQVELELAGLVLDVTELGLAVLPPRHQPAGDAHLEHGPGCPGFAAASGPGLWPLRLLQRLEFGNRLRVRVRPVPLVGVRIDSGLAQLRELGQPDFAVIPAGLDWAVSCRLSLWLWIVAHRARLYPCQRRSQTDEGTGKPERTFTTKTPG